MAGPTLKFVWKLKKSREWIIVIGRVPSWHVSTVVWCLRSRSGCGARAGGPHSHKAAQGSRRHPRCTNKTSFSKYLRSHAKDVSAVTAVTVTTLPYSDKISEFSR